MKRVYVAGPYTQGDTEANVREAMRVETFEKVLDERIAECRAVMLAKQRDYGSDNISGWAEIGVAVRLTDKVMRLKNLLTKHKAPSNESLRDTAVDITNYGLILLMLLDGKWGRPMEEELPTSE